MGRTGRVGPDLQQHADQAKKQPLLPVFGEFTGGWTVALQPGRVGGQAVWRLP